MLQILNKLSFFILFNFPVKKMGNLFNPKKRKFAIFGFMDTPVESENIKGAPPNDDVGTLQDVKIYDSLSLRDSTNEAEYVHMDVKAKTMTCDLDTTFSKVSGLSFKAGGSLNVPASVTTGTTITNNSNVNGILSVKDNGATNETVKIDGNDNTLLCNGDATFTTKITTTRLDSTEINSTNINNTNVNNATLNDSCNKISLTNSALPNASLIVGYDNTNKKSKIISKGSQQNIIEPLEIYLCDNNGLSQLHTSFGSNVLESRNIRPTTDNSFNLGETGKRFNLGYIRNLQSSLITTDSLLNNGTAITHDSIIPATTTSFIGTSSNVFNNVFSRFLNFEAAYGHIIDCNDNDLILEGQNYVVSNKTFIAGANNSFDLGSSTRKWKTVYANNIVVDTIQENNALPLFTNIKFPTLVMSNVLYQYLYNIPATITQVNNPIVLDFSFSFKTSATSGSVGPIGGPVIQADMGTNVNATTRVCANINYFYTNTFGDNIYSGYANTVKHSKATTIPASYGTSVVSTNIGTQFIGIAITGDNGTNFQIVPYTYNNWSGQAVVTIKGTLSIICTTS